MSEPFNDAPQPPSISPGELADWRHAHPPGMARKVFHYASYFSPFISLESAVAGIIQKQQEQASFANFFEDPNADSMAVAVKLKEFLAWMPTCQSWYGDNRTRGWVKPRDLSRQVIASVGLAISRDPGVIDPAVDFFTQVSQAAMVETATEVNGRSLRQLGEVAAPVVPIATEYLQDSMTALGELADKDVADVLGQEASRGAISLASELTDAKVIFEDFWYKHGVREIRDHPNLDFLKVMYARLIASSQDAPLLGANHEDFYSDAAKFMSVILNSYVNNPARSVRTERIAEEVRGDKPIASVVELANTIEAEPPLAVSISSVPAAFSRLLEQTRTITHENSEVHQDRIYALIVDWIINRARTVHDQVYPHSHE